MPLPPELLEQILNEKHKDTEIKLAEIFAEYLEAGRLHIENFDFYKFGPELSNFDFSGCVLTRCNFSHLKLVNCKFDIGEQINCEFQGIYKGKGTSLPASNSEEDKSENETYFGSQTITFFGSGTEENWFKYTLSHFPSAVLKYKNLKTYQRLLTSSQQEGFFGIENNSNKKGNYLGWKFHISVAIEKVPDAFDAIAVILYQNFEKFKVIDVDVENNTEPTSRRLRVGAQFTVYLNEADDGTPIISVERLVEILTQIQTTLMARDINLGIYPVSDERLTIPYFSIRNDQYFVHPIDSTLSYISAAVAGTNFNPGNRINPYLRLQQHQEEVFDPVTHFSKLDKSTPENLLAAMTNTTVAMLHCYVNSTKFYMYYVKSPQTFEDIFIMAAFEDLPDKTLIKPEYQQEIFFKRIKVLFGLLAYFSYVISREVTFNETPLACFKFQSSRFEPELNVIFSAFEEASSTISTAKQNGEHVDRSFIPLAERPRNFEDYLCVLSIKRVKSLIQELDRSEEPSHEMQEKILGLLVSGLERACRSRVSNEKVKQMEWYFEELIKLIVHGNRNFPKNPQRLLTLCESLATTTRSRFIQLAIGRMYYDGMQLNQFEVSLIPPNLEKAVYYWNMATAEFDERGCSDDLDEALHRASKLLQELREKNILNEDGTINPSTYTLKPIGERNASTDTIEWLVSAEKEAGLLSFPKNFGSS